MRIHRNMPNPFNPDTLIRYSLSVDGPVRIRVYDPSGRLVRTLVDRFEVAGDHRVGWNGRDEQGREMGSGVYLLRVESDGQSRTGKMMLLK